VLSTSKVENWQLTKEGKEYQVSGSPEAQVWNALSAPKAMTDLDKVGVANAVKKGWISIDKKVKPPLASRAVSSIVDDTKAVLTAVAAGTEKDEKVLADLSKRKLVSKRCDVRCSYCHFAGADRLSLSLPHCAALHCTG
jgi:hypothetical protein